jgi:chromosome segregation ATPase
MCPALPESLPAWGCWQVREVILGHERAEAAAKADAVVTVEKLQEELAAATAHQQELQQQVQQQQANIDQQVQGWQKASEEAAAEVRQLTASIAKVTQQQEVSNTH